MGSDPDRDVSRMAAELSCGSIVAAAGCGKTEQIARAVSVSRGRRLILTHTHAGVDAIASRLIKHRAPSSLYRVETIAGWCLRFVLSFPQRSGCSIAAPRTSDHWTAVYKSASQLLDCGALDEIVAASYAGLFVDEYQDCTLDQHDVIRRLATRLPTCVFGDPLQSIFDFGGQKPVAWEQDVFPCFPKAGELTTPWRWRNAGNEELAEWLRSVRNALEKGSQLRLDGAPPSVRWKQLPQDDRLRVQAVRKECLASMADVEDSQRLIVIGDSASSGSRAALAKQLARQYFSTIEPVNCKELFKAAATFDAATESQKLDCALKFVGSCMTGSEKAELMEAIVSRMGGGKKGLTKFGESLLASAVSLKDVGTDIQALSFLQEIGRRPNTRLYRREMFYAMCAALQAKVSGQVQSIADGVWHAQNRFRHAGRKFGKYSIGSTLLVKGLEFEHAVIAETSPFDRKDWYVALTRASLSIRVVTPTKRLIA